MIIIYSSKTHVGWFSTEIHRNKCAETDVQEYQGHEMFFSRIWTLLFTDTNEYYASATYYITYIVHVYSAQHIKHYIYLFRSGISIRHWDCV